ncbi:hypothetical protein LCGC14_1082750 [marine sediment metagenome]|uniref:Glycosyl hydrolase 36 catalytic domain-containing protein n=1 Tax=marine sediment metagenome TaxID=412755 RepID=A0A0F9QKP9_9ZZZZ
MTDRVFKKGFSEISSNNNDKVSGGFVEIDGEPFYKIANYHLMEPFFMTITSPQNHWMFLSTTGGITAGRINANNALFPYYTVDKITENHENTGSKIMLKVLNKDKDEWIHWEPFSDRYAGLFFIRRDIFKNIPGNIVIFQETNSDLELVCRLTWTTSPSYGIVKRTEIINTASFSRSIKILDGVQNVLPPMITEHIQKNLSNLLNAYKRNELVEKCGLGIYSLNARLTDRPGPSEALGASSWWQHGLEAASILLSSRQLSIFRSTSKTETERDIKGRRGAYFIQSSLKIDSGNSKSWFFCGEVNQRHVTIHNLVKELINNPLLLKEKVENDIKQATKDLKKIIGLNDGLQKTGSILASSHHFNNVMFNLMRGGYFFRGYSINSKDLTNFISGANNQVSYRNDEFLARLPSMITITDLIKEVDNVKDPDLKRLAMEYLPITFSRRHGDPSRPWNIFSINTRNDDGTVRIGFEGNWRDIFQNWESLLLSNPNYVFNVISKFLNATTADGYNPYRISRSGIAWEMPEPDNPWTNFGYWSDHQIIYLSKLLELAEHYFPGKLGEWLSSSSFVYADVPYEIKSYEQIKADPENSIQFMWKKDKILKKRSEKIGSDGLLLTDTNGNLYHSTMIEKVLILLLAKLTNFVPNGGIWMNTQRPEWNDANNALVGHGLSIVTLSYLIRYSDFILKLIRTKIGQNFELFEETATWYNDINNTLTIYSEKISSSLTDLDRLIIMDRFGKAGEKFRKKIYKNGFSDKKNYLSGKNIIAFLELAGNWFRDTLRNNIREDNLLHSYNTLEITPEGAKIHNLYEMLEGQVAGISSFEMTPKEVLKILKSLRESRMYREDQNTYMLYPDRKSVGFLRKNTISKETVAKNLVLQKVLKFNNNPILEPSQNGSAHFNWTFRNNTNLKQAIESFNQQHPNNKLSAAEKNEILKLYEDVFDHRSFTGRSGTFFAYEGLGSIYWHMVSKLLLAAQETVLRAAEQEDMATAFLLRNEYFQIRDGIGYSKTPDVYGAFPIDPYSHSPAGSGAKQPGMTGMVKEEIITRQAELGLFIKEGQIHFIDILVDDREYLTTEDFLEYYDFDENRREIKLEKGSYAFTFCQVPIIVSRGKEKVVINNLKGEGFQSDNLVLSKEDSLSVFNKTGEIQKIKVYFKI